MDCFLYFFYFDNFSKKKNYKKTEYLTSYAANFKYGIEPMITSKSKLYLIISTIFMYQQSK